MKIRIMLMIAGILVSSAASSAESMRCGHRVVTDGDPKAKVAELCGQPTHAERRTVYRSGLPRQRFLVDEGTLQSVSYSELLIHNRSLVEVEVDVWLYNRGRSRLMREVIFHDNRVVEVNVLGHGF
jgi:hypothetical protein